MSTKISTTSLSDTLPSTVPKLLSSGENWVIFRLRFEDAVEAKGFLGHFDGTTPHPAALTTQSPQGGTAAAAQTRDLAEEVAQWEKNERSAKSLLTQKIPDSTLILIQGKKSVKDRWDAVVSEYTDKDAFAKSDLRNEFMSMRCPAKGNVKEFLENLRVRREELITMDVEINEIDYRSTIISSLPPNLSSYASAIMTAVYTATRKQIEPNLLIQSVSAEYRRLSAYAARNSRSSNHKNDHDEALQASSSSGSRPGRNSLRGPCFNCGKSGHWRRECPEVRDESDEDGKGKGGDGKGVSKDGDHADAVDDDTDSELEGAFACHDVDKKSPTRVPVSQNLETMDGKDSTLSPGPTNPKPVVLEEDWWPADLLSADSPVIGEVNCVEGDETDDEGDVDDGVVVEAIAVGLDSPEAGDMGAKVELNDTGCSNHITPYKDDLENFVEIPRKAFRVANRQKMYVTGIGDLSVSIPNGHETTKIRLTGVLYCAQANSTLVSMGQLDDIGLSVLLGGGKCVVMGANGERLGVIEKSNGVYRVVHGRKGLGGSAKAVGIGDDEELASESRNEGKWSLGGPPIKAGISNSSAPCTLRYPPPLRDKLETRIQLRSTAGNDGNVPIIFPFTSISASCPASATAETPSASVEGQSPNVLDLRGSKGRWFASSNRPRKVVFCGTQVPIGLLGGKKMD
ncbi:hypothetical protein ONZ45_g9696 [Pleurotus djamor]|nr:hypothetical protein ONZ45_g9696 [Pleurotus djamor]